MNTEQLTALDEACYGNEAAEKELARLRKDAARYNWIKGDNEGAICIIRMHWGGDRILIEGAADKEIDAEIEDYNGAE